MPLSNAPAVTVSNSSVSSSGPRVTYTFRVDQPEAAGTFVAGALQLFPVQAEGLNISVYLPPSAASSAQDYGGAVARIVNVLSDEFGPLPKPAAGGAVPVKTVASTVHPAPHDTGTAEALVIVANSATAARPLIAVNFIIGHPLA